MKPTTFNAALLATLLCCSTVAAATGGHPTQLRVESQTPRTVRILSHDNIEALAAQEIAMKHTPKTGSPVVHNDGLPQLKLMEVRPYANEETARITIYNRMDWGDGTGYQVLLDSDANIYGTYVDEEYYPDLGVYDQCEYLLPEDATATGGMVMYGEVESIDIPGGIYDYVVTNPAPSQGMIYAAMGESRGNDYEFKAGAEYIFLLTPNGDHDNCALQTRSPSDIGIDEIIMTSAEGLTANEHVTIKVTNTGTQNTIESFTAGFSIDGGETTYETVTKTIGVRESAEYTFTAPADLSADGKHIVSVTVTTDGDKNSGNDTLSKVIWHIYDRPAPYTCDFNEIEDMDEWVITSNNGDPVTWKWDDGSSFDEGTVNCGYNTALDMDDYMVTICPIYLNAGTANVQLHYRSALEGSVEGIEILMGTTPDFNDMLPVFTNTTINGSKSMKFSPANFNVEVSDAYYFAIHGISAKNQYFLIVDDFTVENTRYVGRPDATITDVILPASSTTLDEFEDVSTVVSNIGTDGLSTVTLKCTINGETFITQDYDVDLAPDQSKTIHFNKFADFSQEGDYEVTVEIISTIEAEGALPEENKDNNTYTATVSHYTPAEVPFSVDLTDEDEHTLFACTDDSWLYDSTNHQGIYCQGNSMLTSCGINLVGGRSYRINYTYSAGAIIYIFQFTESYKVFCGIDGTDPYTEWDEIASYTDVYTDEHFVEGEFTFKVPADGVYSIGFKQDSPYGTFIISDFRISEVPDNDIRINSVSGMPSMVPALQRSNVPVDITIENRGTKNIDGSVSVTVDKKMIATKVIDEMLPTTPVVAEFSLNLPKIDVGTTTDVVIKSSIVDGEDVDESNNTITTQLTATEDVLAYDFVTDEMFASQAGIGLPDSDDYGFGTVMHINAPASLLGVEAAWSKVPAGNINVEVFEWDETNLSYGNSVIGETFPIGEGGRWQRYEYSKTATLQPGYYLVVIQVTQPATYILSDMTDGGSFYLVYLDDDEIYDQSGNGFGTPGIRLVLGEAVGISDIQADKAELKLYPNPASETLYIDGGNETINSFEIYSATGALVESASFDNGTQSATCDVSQMPAGMYIVRITTSSGCRSARIMVK